VNVWAKRDVGEGLVLLSGTKSASVLFEKRGP